MTNPNEEPKPTPFDPADLSELAALRESDAALLAENQRLRLIAAGARDSEALAAHLRAENEALRADLKEALACNRTLAEDQRPLLADLAAERARAVAAEQRAEALAARVEMMKQVGDEMLYQFSEPTFPGTECRQSGHVRLSTITAWRAFLNSTPSADLEAHDAKVREPLEKWIAELEAKEEALLAVLPEDVGAVEYIQHLEKERRSLLASEDRLVMQAQADELKQPAHDARMRREALGTGGVEAIAAERKRQIEQEGWTPEHDDEHDSGELAAAAACPIALGIRDGLRTVGAVLFLAGAFAIARASWPVVALLFGVSSACSVLPWIFRLGGRED